MVVKKLEVRVMPAGNTAGNFLACRPSGMRACGAGDDICVSVPPG